MKREWVIPVFILLFAVAIFPAFAIAATEREAAVYVGGLLMGGGVIALASHISRRADRGR